MATRCALPWLLAAAVLCGATERCPSCGAETERRLLEEAAKRQLLDGLRLRERPRIAHAVPRVAVARALRRLQAEGPRRGDPPEDERRFEIISFAEEEPTSSPGTVLRFHLSPPPDQDVRVVQVQLWLYVRVPRGAVTNVTLSISLLEGHGDIGGERRVLLSARRLSARGSGWRTFSILPALRGSFGAERGTLRLHLQSSGDGGGFVTASNATQPRQPFLVASASLRDPEHRVVKRSLRCSRDSSLCCRRDHYVDFRSIGWNDWIISPEGYQLNYCVGQCPLHVAGSPGMASSFHSAVLSLVKANNVRTAAHSCCVPTRRRPLSLLYFDRNSNIVKTDIPDMIVDACGCS